MIAVSAREHGVRIRRRSSPTLPNLRREPSLVVLTTDHEPRPPTPVTERPGSQVSYTQNWPHEPLVGNRPTGEAVVWSVISFVLLLAGIGALAWYHGRRVEPEPEGAHPPRDPLFGLAPTASQRATVK